MSYTEYYKGFCLEIWKDFTFPKPHNWLYGIHIEFDAWLRKGQMATDFETAQRSARYAVIAYVSLERIPEPKFHIGQAVWSKTSQGKEKHVINHSTWHRGESTWYYKSGGIWKPEPDFTCQ